MSDAPPSFDFSQFVPGFDFLKNLTSASAKAGSAVPGIPGMSNWVAPTLSVEEVEKRIQELKTVQYWLEQNGHALKATIQALEVQKMTLSTLRGMNVRMEDLANAFTRAATPRAAPPEPAASPAQEPEAQPADEDQAAAGVVDPMQWWGALTQQFQQIATTALQDASNLKMPAMAQPMADAMNQVGQAVSGAVKAATVASAAAKAPASARKPSPRKPAARKKPAAKKAGTASRRRAAGGRPE